MILAETQVISTLMERTVALSVKKEKRACVCKCVLLQTQVINFTHFIIHLQYAFFKTKKSKMRIFQKTHRSFSCFGKVHILKIRRYKKQ